MDTTGQDKRWGTPISKDVLKRYLALGLTQPQMVEKFYEETGERRARSSFAVAIKRSGLKPPPPKEPRYAKYLPWRPVKKAHYCYDQRMLRAYASQELGEPNADALSGRLTRWLNEMDRTNSVVMYVPDHGFFRVEREDGDQGYITIKNLPKP